MRYSVKKIKEIRDRYMYSFEFIRCGFGKGFVSLSNPFLKIPAHLPNHLTSKVITYKYYRKIFLGE